MDPITAGVMIGGAALKFGAGRAAAKKQEKIARRAQARQGALQGDADRAVRQQILDVQGENPGAERQALEQSFVSQLMRARGQADRSMSAVPMASRRFQQDSAAARASTEAGARAQARDFATIDTPARMLQRRAQGMVRTGDRLAMLGQQSAGVNRTAGLQAGAVAVNPWVSVLSDAMQAYGGWRAGQVPGRKPDMSIPVVESVPTWVR